MSKKTQQFCHCGWSEVTTYQGLRTHQGMMGCTPKGLGIPQSKQSLLPSLSYSSFSRPAISYTPPTIKSETYSSVYKSPKPQFQPSQSSYTPSYSSTTQSGEDQSLQTCHCGWSKVTTYHGLRTHQGKMGCTPKGLGIPEDLQCLFNNNSSLSYKPPALVRGFDHYTVNASIWRESDPVISPLPVLTEFSDSSSVASEASIKVENNSYFESPQPSLQSATDVNKTRRALDFSAVQLHTQTLAMAPAIPTSANQTLNLQLADVEQKENKPSAWQQSFQSAPSQTQEVVLSTAQQPESLSAQPASANGGKEANTIFGTATQSSFNFSVNGNRGVDTVTAAQQNFSTQPYPEVTEAEMDTNQLFIGTPNKRQALDFEALQVNQTLNLQLADVELKEDKPSAWQQSFQSAPSQTQEVVLSTAQQLNSTAASIPAEKKEAKSLIKSSQFDFYGNTSEKTTQQNFTTQLNPEATEATGKMDTNQPLFGTPHKPLQSSDDGNKTRRALDFATPQSVFKPQSFSTPPTSANGGKEEANSTFGGATQPLFNFSGKGGFDMFTAAQQNFSTQPNPEATEATDEMDTNQPLFGTPHKPLQSSSVFKPQSFSPQPTSANGGKEEANSIFRGTLPPFNLFGTRGFDTSTAAQQQSVSKPESFTTQPPAANGGGAQEENKSLFQTPPPPVQSPNNGKKSQSSSGLFSGTQQFTVPMSQNLSTRPTSTKTDVAVKVFGSPQHPTTTTASLQTKSFGVSASAQQPISQTPTPQPGPKTSAATAENKPGSKTPQPTTKATGAPQPVQAPVSRSSPVTPQPAVQKENKSLTDRPQQPSQSATHVNKTKGAPDFSTGAQQLQKDKMKAEIRHKIQSREQKLAEVRSSVKACKGSLDKEWLEINNVFSDVIKAVEETRRRALQPLENRREKLKKEAHSLIKKLQEDIEKLEKAMDEVDSAADLDEDSLTTLKSQDLNKMQVKTSFSFGSLQSTVSNMMEQIQEELGKLSAVELKRASIFAVDVKLDPTTAHHFLVISEDGKKVQDGGQSQLVPTSTSPGRFDTFGSILGANKFSSGRSYWEVEVGNKSGWDLGVTSAKANRKGKLTLNPDTGYWAIVHYDDDKYGAMTAPPVCLELKDKPLKVGVFLDYEEGLVSFYNVTTRAHIHSFTKCCFNDDIFPYFSPHPKNNGKNSEPLVISPVKN